MRVGIVGDVHGHARELRAIVTELVRVGMDRIILLGDLLDRGPAGLECLRFVRRTVFRALDGQWRHLECLMGNHEDAYLRAKHGLPKPGQLHPVTPESRPMLASLTEADFAWLAARPLYVRIPELGVTCLHGGVTPRHHDLDEAGAEVLRVRYLDRNSRALPSTASSTRFWADSYFDARFGTIVFGHESHARVTRYPHAIAVDGEGFWTLNAVVVSDDGYNESVLSIGYGGTTVRWGKCSRPRVDRFYDWRPPVSFRDYAGGNDWYKTSSTRSSYQHRQLDLWPHRDMPRFTREEIDNFVW